MPKAVVAGSLGFLLAKKETIWGTTVEESQSATHRAQISSAFRRRSLWDELPAEEFLAVCSLALPCIADTNCPQLRAGTSGGLTTFKLDCFFVTLYTFQCGTKLDH